MRILGNDFAGFASHTFLLDRRDLPFNSSYISMGVSVRKGYRYDDM